jgi:hypothetical protein
LAGTVYHDISSVWDTSTIIGLILDPVWGQDVNATLDDKISKTDTSDQTITSNVDISGGLDVTGALTNIGTFSLWDGTIFSGTSAGRIALKNDIWVYIGAKGGGTGIAVIENTTLDVAEVRINASDILFLRAYRDNVTPANSFLRASYHFEPASGDSFDLGSTGLYWKDGYINKIYTDDIALKTTKDQWVYYTPFDGTEIKNSHTDPTMLEIVYVALYRYVLQPDSAHFGSSENPEFAIPVHLPDGVTVNQLWGRALSNRVNSDVNVRLIRTDRAGTGAGSVMAELNWDNSGSTPTVKTDSTISDAVIDNANYYYYIFVSFTVNSIETDPANQRFWEARIRYQASNFSHIGESD